MGRAIICVALFLSGTTAEAAEFIPNDSKPDVCETHLRHGQPSISSMPAALARAYPKLHATQPGQTTLRLDGFPEPTTFTVHNARLLPFFKAKPSLEDLADLVLLLKRHGAFDVPVTASGLLPAAANDPHHSGGYGAYVWLRDLARAYEGLSLKPKLLEFARRHRPNSLSADQIESAREPARRLARGAEQVFRLPDQIRRAALNVLWPEKHGAREEGFDQVIHVRLALKPLEENRSPTDAEATLQARWGHKQNDALALFGHAILDSLRTGDLHPADVSLPARAQFLMLMGYFWRLNYYNMRDTGAWEELNGKRASSIGLVTSFLERLQSGLSATTADPRRGDSLFLRELAQDWNTGRIEAHLVASLSSDLGFTAEDAQKIGPLLRQALQEMENQRLEPAYEVLNRQLGLRDPLSPHGSYGALHEVLEGSDGERRGPDAALLHLLLRPPARLTPEDLLHVAQTLKTRFERPSGFVRYERDWFLYGPPTAMAHANRLPLPVDGLAERGSGHVLPTNLETRTRIVEAHGREKYSKDMAPVTALAGEGYEAQWTFQDSMLVQIYSDLYVRTGDPEHLQIAWYHLLRVVGLISNEASGDSGQLTIEGQPLRGWQLPEAWVPVPVALPVTEAGRLETATAYFASPNSPLIWSLAELIAALTRFAEALEANPP